MPQAPLKRTSRSNNPNEPENINAAPQRVHRVPGRTGNNQNPDLNQNSNSYAPPVHSVQRHRIANSNQGRRQFSRRQRQSENVKKTPLMLKLLSWLGAALLCFVIGYLGATWFTDLLSRKLLLKPDDIVENQEDLQKLQSSEQERANMSVSPAQSVSLNLHYVLNNEIVDVRKNFPVRTQEDNMKAAFDEIILSSQIPGTEKIKLLQISSNVIQEPASLPLSSRPFEFIFLLQNIISLSLWIIIIDGYCQNYARKFSADIAN